MSNVSSTLSVAHLLADHRVLVETLQECDAEIARGESWAVPYRARLDAQLAELEARIEGRVAPLGARLDEKVGVGS